MHIKILKVFCDVAARRSFSRGAKENEVSQSAASQMVQHLEERLGVKLFQRHARGYSTTEAGEDLLRVAQATDDQFSQLAGRIKGRGNDVSGELVITSLGGFSHLLVPVLTEFRQEYPDIILRYLTGDRLFRLEYGEAHVAIRAGRAPDQPDNVVQPFYTQAHTLYAAQSYVDRHGLPASEEEFDQHWFVSADDPKNRAPFNQWLRQTAPEERIIFRSQDVHAQRRAIVDGAGIGFLSKVLANQLGNLTEVMPARDEWSSPIWLVTHMDLHRTTKVQAFLRFLKDRAKAWQVE